MKHKIWVISGIIALLISLLASTLTLAMPGADARDGHGKIDDRVDPLTASQREMRQTALNAVLHGKAQGPTHQVDRGQYVELEREGEDPVWTVLGEFSDYPHNNIPEPDRSVDNSTIWEDFSRDYYLEMLFAEGEGVNSMREYYIEQSSNRYTVYGDVTDWVSLPGEACEYDDGDPGPGDAESVWQFLIDSTRGWYDAQIAAGKTPDEIDAYLSEFDVWDRYDWDEDGIFDEPDGYIDHMQFVHSGEGNEAGGGELGDCSIWSHSWFAYYNLIDEAGPSPEFLIGGVQIGDSSYWLNKYTIQPENGGVGVFAHEYAHDLGLPDHYDYTGENSTGFWTIMSSGSWLSQNDEDIGSQPNHLSAWGKLQLGWLNYEEAYAGQQSVHDLGPAEFNTRQAQGLLVVLPNKVVTEEIGDPYSGEYFYYSGSGNDLDNWMYKLVTLGADSSLSAMVNYEIELDWDYAYVVVSTDGGTNWTSVETNFSVTTDPNDQNFGYGITGSSDGWEELTADLSDYTGDVLIGFRYWTDVAAVEPGFMVDDIAITGGELDDAESTPDWTFDGFKRTTGTETGSYENYYIAEFRQYLGYDAGLDNAYNFGWVNDQELYNYVEHFSYQEGLLISYWDTSFADNDVGANCEAGRCGGLILPVDAHPELMYWHGKGIGGIVRNRIQTYDATFGLKPTDAITLHWYGFPTKFPSQPGNPIFNDMLSDYYYNEDNPMGSVIVPNTGTVIEVKAIRGGVMKVEVRPAE